MVSAILGFGEQKETGVREEVRGQRLGTRRDAGVVSSEYGRRWARLWVWEENEGRGEEAGGNVSYLRIGGGMTESRVPWLQSGQWCRS